VQATEAQGSVEPIVIVGTGRCGSTLLHRLLALHDDLGWITTYNEAFPTQTWLAAFASVYRAPLPARLKEAKGFPKPYEAYRFWEHYLPGFSRRDKPQTADDVFEPGIDRVRRATARIVSVERRRRLLVKVTGWSRIAYFDRIYPDARFVSLRREPRSVVSSWIKAGWLDVTSPPDSRDWQWGYVRPELVNLWHELGGGPILSAVLKIWLDLEDIGSNMTRLPGRCHELSYEELIRDPEPTLRDLCAFGGLGWTPRFERVVRSARLYDSTEKWREYLTEEQGDLVLEFLDRAKAFHGDAHGSRVEA
jgi:Sulfotransferase family